MSYGGWGKYDYHFNPCNECKRRGDCYGCRLTKLKEELDDTAMKLDSAEYKIRTELEPRIQAERRRYDNWATSPER